nr:hypothetical protein [Planctomycetota bacterium]
MRRFARILVSILLVIAILIEVAWLASGPLFDRLLAPLVAEKLAAALDATEVRLAGPRGNLFSSFGIDTVDVKGGRAGVEQ